jgi:hypothetical protein
MNPGRMDGLMQGTRVCPDPTQGLHSFRAGSRFIQASSSPHPTTTTLMHRLLSVMTAAAALVGIGVLIVFQM